MKRDPELERLRVPLGVVFKNYAPTVPLPPRPPRPPRPRPPTNVYVEMMERAARKAKA